MRTDISFPAYFDADWFRATDMLVSRYISRGSDVASNVRAWERTPEYARAREIFGRAVKIEPALEHVEVLHRMSAVPDFDGLWARILREADRNGAYRADLERLIDDYGMGVIEIVERVNAGGMFKLPDKRGRPAGKRFNRGAFSFDRKLRLAAKAVRLTLEKQLERDAAVQQIAATVEKGPHTKEATRKAIYSLYDAVLWRLEARVYAAAKKEALF